MGEEIDDPILKQLNGTAKTKKAVATPVAEESEDDPILQKLNQVKKKEPTVEDQSSADGFIGPTQGEFSGGSPVVTTPSVEPTEKSTQKPHPIGPFGITNPLTRSAVSFFFGSAPKTIYREALKNMPSNYEELMERTERGPTDAEETGLLSMERIKSTPLKDLLAEYKERSAEEPGTQWSPDKNRAAKQTYDILLRASKSSNPTPERVMAFYKDEVNRLIQKDRDKFEKKKIGGSEDIEKVMTAGIPQDFTSIKSAKDFKNWLGGSIGQGLASSAAFATTPAILFKMERYDALDEIRAKKAESLSEKFGTEVTPKSLEKIQTKEENEADESLANTVGLISMGLEGLGFLAGAGKAAKQVFFKSAKKQLLEQATKYGIKGASKDVAIAGGGEFATEYLQDIDQQVGGLVATGMGITEAMANVDHQRAFNAGMQGLAPGAVFGGVTASSRIQQSVTDVVKGEQNKVDPNDVNALDKSAEAIQDSVDASEQEVVQPKPEVNEAKAPVEEVATPVVPEGQLSEVAAPAAEAQTEETIAQVEPVKEEVTDQANIAKPIGEAVPYTPEPALNDKQRQIETRFGTYLNENFEEAKATYNKKFGDVMNTDLARELSEDYQSDRSQSAAVHNPASVFIEKLLNEKIADPAITGVEFTAGGSGAGKSSSNIHKEGTLTYDSNLSNYDTAVDKIDRVLENKKEVEITYTFRDPVDAFENGVIPRMLHPESESYQRVVPIPVHVKNHIGAYENVGKLAEKYADNENVNIHVIDNSRGKGKQKEISIADLPDFKYTAKELTDRLNEHVEKLLKEGTISQTQYEAFRGTKEEKSDSKVREMVQGDSGRQDSQTPGNQVTPETEKPITENKPAPQERKFAKQVLEDPNVSKEVKKGLSEDAKSYVPKGLRITDQEAKAIIEVKGPEQAMADFLDRSNEMPEDTRAVLAQNLIRHFNQAQDFDSAVKVADNLSKWYTDLGRAVNAGKVFQFLTPEGVLRYVSKEITKAKADYTRKTGGKRKQSKDAVDYINKQALDKVLSNPKIKNRISSEVKKGRIKQAIDFLEKLKIDTKGKALDVTYGLTAEAWNTLITVVQKGLEAGLTISQAINKGIAKSKTKEFDQDGAKAYLSEQLKDYRVALDPELAIKEELRAQNDKIENIIREHYTVVDEKKRTLVDKLVKDANLDEAQAKVVAEDLAKEFDRLTGSAKEKALKKYLPKEKKPNKAERSDLIKTITRASNLGALSDELYRDTISEKIGVKSMSAEEAKKVTDLANKVQKAKEGFDKNRATQHLLDYISGIDGYSAVDIGMAIWYANILSGLSTQVLNISANFTETMGEAYLAAVTSPKEFGWIFKGLFSGWGRGFLEAMDTLQHGYNPTKFEQKISTSPILERVTFKGGPWNPYNYLKYVSRLMNAADIFFYQGLNEMRSRELAVKTAKKDGKYKTDKSAIKKAKEMIYKGEKPWLDAFESAKQEGWTGRDLKRRTYEIIEQQRPEFIISDSNDAAARGTFNYEPEGTLGALTSLVNLASEKVNILGVKPIKFIIPFTRIISNVANRYLDWTPVGLLRAAKGGIGFSSLGENLHREYTPEERQKVLTRAMTGIIGFTALYALSDEDDGPFEITADGTGDVFKNYELQETGWRPYSIKINGTWYEYKNTPIAIPMATLGYLRDLGKYRGQKDIEAKVSIVMFGTMKYIMDLSFLQSLSAFFDTFSKDNTSSADSFFKKATKRTEATAKSFVIPNAFTQVSRAMQEVMDLPVKRANSFGDQIIRDLPILRDRLGNIYDALGDPVVPNQTERFIPLKPSKSTEEHNKLWTLIADNGAWIGRPGRGTLKPNGEGLTDDEYDEFSLMAGRLTKQKLLLEYYFLSQLKDKEEIKNEISRIKGEARREARDTLFGFELF